jgi:hypothetical protein
MYFHIPSKKFFIVTKCKDYVEKIDDNYIEFYILEKHVISNSYIEHFFVLILFNDNTRKYSEHHKQLRTITIDSFAQKYDREKDHKQPKHLMMRFDFDYSIE